MITPGLGGQVIINAIEILINIEDNSRERVTKHEGDQAIIIAIGTKDKIFEK